MLKQTIVAALLLASSGCGEFEENLPTVHGPDGRTYWELTCANRADCREQLSEYCHHGYETADEEVLTGAAVAHTSTSIFGSTTVVNQVSYRSLMFRCNDDKVTLAKRWEK